MRPGITVCIPSIPVRGALLRRALESVTRQTLPAAAVAVAVDLGREGAAITRQRALETVRTEWVAFLDDDDEMHPDHLLRLYDAAEEFNASYLWSRFRIAYPGKTYKGGGVGYTDFADGPAPLGRGTFEQWNDAQPAQTTVTTMVRTEVARLVGGFASIGLAADSIDGQRAGEDWLFTLACREAVGLEGMRHVPYVTWTWHHHGRNTSGLPSNW